MILFAVITLVVLLIGLTHLYNWVWRNLPMEESPAIIPITVIYLFLVGTCIKYIIVWGSKLTLI